LKNSAQSLKEVTPIGIALEYLFPLNATHHNMVNGACGIYA
jgi:hypothetical protein